MSIRAVILDDPMVEVETEAMESLLNNLAWPFRSTSTWRSATPSGSRASSRLAHRRHRESRMIAVRAAESQLAQ